MPNLSRGGAMAFDQHAKNKKDCLGKQSCFSRLASALTGGIRAPFPSRSRFAVCSLRVLALL
jgi:hypothetical protein